MATPVEVPKLGNTVEECLIAKWRKHKGERVSAGEVVAEIETDKATFEVTAPADGIILETFFDEGALVPVFTNLFVIGEAGESVDAFRPQGAAAPAAKQAAPPQHPRRRRPIANRPARCPPRRPDPSVPAPGALPRSTTSIPPPSPVPAPPAGFSKRTCASSITNPRESPLWRTSASRRAWRLAARVPARAAWCFPATWFRRVRPPPACPASARPLPAACASHWLPPRSIRSILRPTPAACSFLRAKIKASTGVPDININDLVTFCAIQALLAVPDVNVEFIDGKIHKHREVHMAFACDTPRGLMVPVVRDAHALTAGQLSVKMKELTAQAVKGTVSPDDLSGGTFTVSNLGGLGIESFTPVLNPPQVAILGVDSIQLKPVRREGRIEFIDAIGLSITFDHQVIDGAPGARFLKVVKEKIENVESICTI